jgi:hypothetical protein
LSVRPPHADILTVNMLEGQAAADFHHRRTALATGLGVADVTVRQGEIPARVELVLLLTSKVSHAAVGPRDWPPAAVPGNPVAHVGSRGQTGTPVHDDRPDSWSPGREGGAA